MPSLPAAYTPGSTYSSVAANNVASFINVQPAMVLNYIICI
jgi:hypothetical protein